MSEYPSIPLDAIGTDGSFQIGDGFKFGQDYTESMIRALFRIPTSNLGEAMDLIKDQLLKVPLDVLKIFKDFIPGSTDDDFIDTLTAATTIIDNLLAKPFISELLTLIQTIIDFLTNNALAQCLVEWFGEVSETTGEFLTDLVAAFMHLLTELNNGLINNPALNALKDLVEDSGLLVLNILNGAAEAIARLLSLIGFANPAAALDFLETLVNDVWEVLSGAVAGGAKTLQDIFDVFTSWVDSVPALQAIIEAITGLASITTLEGLAEWIRQNLLTIASKIPAVNLIGQIPSALLGVLNVGHLTNEPINLLRNPTFEDSTTVSPVDGWSWDSTQNATGVGGSAKVVCDGFNKELSQQLAVAVAAGDLMRLSAKVKTSGVTGTGWKAALTVMEYRSGAISTPVEIASRNSNTSSWVELVGNYTVPANVSSVVFRLSVENATAGTVWFDDMSFTKTGSIAQEWVGNLTDTWESIYTGVTGGAGSGKRWNDMAPVLGGVSSTANTASTNAGTANTNLGFTWNSLWDAFNGTSGATGKTFTDTASKAGAVRSTANTASTNASTAITNASTAQTAANSATTTANNASTAAANASTAASNASTAASNVNVRVNTTNSRLFGTTADPNSNSKVQAAALDTAAIGAELRVVPSVGSGAKISRTNTATKLTLTATAPGGSDSHRLNANFFVDANNQLKIDRCTSDITPAANGRFTVTFAGWYLVELAFALNSTPGGAGAFAMAPIIFIGNSTTPHKFGSCAFGSYGAGLGGYSREAQASFIVYLPAGGYVEAGAHNYNGTQLTNFYQGDVAGASTYFSISLMNRTAEG